MSRLVTDRRVRLIGAMILPYYLRDAAWHMGPIEPWVVTGEKVGYAVFGFWVTLAIAGRWRLGPGWVERCGAVVGLLWSAGAVGAVAVVLRIRGSELLRSLHWI